MIGMGMRIAGVVYFVIVVREPGRYVNCQEPLRDVNMGTRPERERETLIHQGVVVVVFMGGLVMGGVVLIGMVVIGGVVPVDTFVGVGVKMVIGVRDPPDVAGGAGTYVTIMDVVMVSVVVKPSLVMAVVRTIGSTESEVVEPGTTLVMGPGSPVRVKDGPRGPVVMEKGG